MNMGPLGDAHPPTVVPRRCATLYVLLVCFGSWPSWDCPLPCGAGNQSPVILTSPAVSGATPRTEAPPAVWCVCVSTRDGRTRREESGAHRLACGVGRGFEWADGCLQG